MSFEIKLLPSKLQFNSSSNESILGAAIEQKVVLPGECQEGLCGTCKVQLLKGSIQQSDPHTVLTEKEKADGYFLACSAKAQSDLEIRANVYPELLAFPTQVFPAKIQKIEILASGIDVRL